MELPNSVSEPDIAEGIRKFYEEIAIPAESFARAAAFAMSQPHLNVITPPPPLGAVWAVAPPFGRDPERWRGLIREQLIPFSARMSARPLVYNACGMFLPAGDVVHELPPGDPLTVFISARLQEMAAERLAAGATIAAMRLRPVLFEHARPAPATPPVFLEAARTCDIFVGVYGDEYGDPVGGRPAPIEQEYLETLAAPFMPRLLFVRASRSRQRRLRAFLQRAAPHAAVIPYIGHADFALRLKHGLAVVLAGAFREAHVLTTEQRARRARPAGTAAPLAGER